MQIEVEMHSGYGDLKVPQRFRLDGREVKVSDHLDQWHGADYRYFKLMGDDGNLYILRLDERQLEWELIMFQSTGPSGPLRSCCQTVRDGIEGDS